jgi:energy-coupling factor transporter ATP-binding protein EcfA2
VSVHGRLATFIELGAGFNPMLTGRENAMTNAVLMGVSRRTARGRLAEMLAFAELEPYAELELKQYSSGMKARLAFAVAAHVDADVLLVDELLAVGDAAFRERCFERFADLRRAGATVLLVTHDMGEVQRLCDRALVLEDGRVDLVGPPVDAARRYHELCLARRAGGEPRDPAASDDAWIADTWFEDAAGRRVEALGQGEACVLCMKVRMRHPLEDPVFGARLRSDADQVALEASSALDHGPTGRFDAGETALVRIAFDNWLAPGHYSVTAWLDGGPAWGAALELRPGAASLLVRGTRVTGAVMDPPRRFDLERA